MGYIAIRALFYTLFLLFSAGEFVIGTLLVVNPDHILNKMFVFLATVFGFMCAIWTMALLMYRERTKTSRPLFRSNIHFVSCVVFMCIWLIIAIMLTSHLPLAFQCYGEETSWCDYAYATILLAWALYGTSTAAGIFNFLQSTEIEDEEARNMKTY